MEWKKNCSLSQKSLFRRGGWVLVLSWCKVMLEICDNVWFLLFLIVDRRAHQISFLSNQPICLYSFWFALIDTVCQIINKIPEILSQYISQILFILCFSKVCGCCQPPHSTWSSTSRLLGSARISRGKQNGETSQKYHSCVEILSMGWCKVLVTNFL